MQILFENKYTRDKELARDLYGYMYFRRPIMIVLDIMFALCLLIGIYNSIMAGVVNWVYILWPIVYYAIAVWLYSMNVRAVIKRDLESHGKPVEEIVTVSEDKIRLSQSTGAEYHLNYCDIKKVVQTKKYIYLLSKAKLIYSVKRDAFTIGDAATFLAFLKTKGLK